MNVNLYVKIIPTSELPMKIKNKENSEWEIINMYSVGDDVYVSKEIFNEIIERYGD